MGIGFYILGVITLFLIFWTTHERDELTWGKLVMGILISLLSWPIIIIVAIIMIIFGITIFIYWLSRLDFWNKKVF